MFCLGFHSHRPGWSAVVRSWFTAASASQVARTAGAHYRTCLIFVFFVDMGSHYVAQADLGLMSSSDPLTLVSQSAGITDVSHCARPFQCFLFLIAHLTFFFLGDGVSLCRQAGVQWCHLDSLQTLSPGSSNSAASAS